MLKRSTTSRSPMIRSADVITSIHEAKVSELSSLYAKGDIVDNLTD